MKKAGLPFSGQFDFVETSYVFPTTHYGGPKEKSVAAASATPGQRRIWRHRGVYLPGRDGNRVIEFLGWAAVLGSWPGRAARAGRAVSRRRKEVDP
jgi:hypothetical protein